MKLIQTYYKKVRKNYPEHYSSYYCFFQAVRGRGYSREIIAKWFTRIVDKEDYFPNEKKGIILYLYEVSNDPKEKAFWTKNRL